MTLLNKTCHLYFLIVAGFSFTGLAISSENAPAINSAHTNVPKDCSGSGGAGRSWCHPGSAADIELKAARNSQQSAAARAVSHYAGITGSGDRSVLRHVGSKSAVAPAGLRAQGEEKK